MMDSEITIDDKAEYMKDAVTRLMEHFSSVQIIATVFDPEANQTNIIAEGRGDFFARLGAVRAWSNVEEDIIDGRDDDDE